VGIKILAAFLFVPEVGYTTVVATAV